MQLNLNGIIAWSASRLRRRCASRGVFDEGEGGEAACRGCVLQGNREVWIRVIGSLSGNIFTFGFVTSCVYF